MHERSTPDYYVARQPIFTSGGDVLGYELLHRSGPENVYTAADGAQATAELITGGAFMLGLDELVGDKLAFVNFPRDLLVNHCYGVLPPSRTVVEVLEEVEPDEEVIDACRRLKAAGYGLALDDVISVDDRAALFDLADIVKVDIRPLSRSERASIALHIRRLPNPAKLIAEKVETREQYEEALDLDYDYFQGYYLDRPEMHSGKEIPASGLPLAELQHAVQRPDFDFGEVEAIVKRDIALSFKMLRFANVAARGVTRPIESVRHALVMLGREDLLRTVSLLALAGQGENKPQELAVRSVIRASVCESLALEMDLADERLDHFLVGMFSIIDGILELPMADLVPRLPTSPQVNFALLGTPGPLREVLDLVIAYEDADWPRAQILMRRLGVGRNTLRSVYLEAIAKTDDGSARAA